MYNHMYVCLFVLCVPSDMHTCICIIICMYKDLSTFVLDIQPLHRVFVPLHPFSAPHTSSCMRILLEQSSILDAVDPVVFLMPNACAYICVLT